VKIRVSGQQFVTTASTLVKHQSGFSAILKKAPVDPQGYYLLPTSALTFAMILCYLRDGIVDPKARVDVRYDLKQTKKIRFFENFD
jgi:hypothetical protein